MFECVSVFSHATRAVYFRHSRNDLPRKVLKKIELFLNATMMLSYAERAVPLHLTSGPMHASIVASRLYFLWTSQSIHLVPAWEGDKQNLWPE